MNILNHTLGFPRIGLHRELKKAQERYWAGSITQQELLSVGKILRLRHWQQQKEAGIDLLPVGDFTWYDHVLTTSLLLGNIPLRHQNKEWDINLDTLFRISRGCSYKGECIPAAEMKKWFNTNYHYIVPEFTKHQKFKLTWMQLLDEVDEALALGYNIKPILLGPITYLWLGKCQESSFDRLSLLNNLLPVYQQVLDELVKRKIQWIQIDEPILVLELPQNWINAFDSTYNNLRKNINILLTTYFDDVGKNINIIKNLPVQGLHVDLVHGDYNIKLLNQNVPESWVLSLGVINGRNVWKANLIKIFNQLQKITKQRKKLWIGTSCSLLHSPIDLDVEVILDNEVKSWFAFALQKCQELKLLSTALNNNNTASLQQWSESILNRIHSSRIHNYEVNQRLSKINQNDLHRNSCYSQRTRAQHENLNLPILPTTTIGSFPQTHDIRKLRLKFKKKIISKNQYDQAIAQHIKYAIKEQEHLGLDVLVHGEAERNDMVEYFGEHLNGFIFTEYGWVQSYGSRCVKPPIIIGDISRSKPITVDWTNYAQSLTNNHVKGMLTGPITILFWSFAREDLSNQIIANQIALSLRDEVSDLEKSGIKIIQIDEPALREGLPLKKSKWDIYLNWAINAFKISSSGVKDSTQIHTHMCYCEFNDIIHSIAALDADVITIETARSNMKLLDSFKKFLYPNEIGPGVYDIHSPNIPNVKVIEELIYKALKYIPKNRLWINPDCGLKTRTWKETQLALSNMIQATHNLRKKIM